MSGALPPFPNTPSWRGAQLKKSTGTTLPVPLPWFRERKDEYSATSIPYLKVECLLDCFVGEYS
jgi:hypothetical protein